MAPHNRYLRLPASLSVYLRTSALARAPLPAPPPTAPPPIYFWSHALNRTQALHRPVTDYDSISGTNSFYVTCPTAHFEFILSCSTSYNAPSALSVTPALVRSLSLSQVYDRKLKLLALCFTQRKTYDFTKTMINGRILFNTYLSFSQKNACNLLFPYTSYTLHSHKREFIVRSCLL